MAAWSPSLGAEELLLCGVPVEHDLAAGQTDTYRFAVNGAAAIQVVDTSGTIGLLKMSVTNGMGTGETCSGSTHLISPFGTGSVSISDCIGQEAGSYTIALSALSPGPNNCGVPLPCDTPLSSTLGVPGEVDSYTFPHPYNGSAKSDVTIEASAVDPSLGPLRLRIYDPEARDFVADSCSGVVTARVSRSTTATVLASACNGLGTGAYTLKRLSGGQYCPPPPQYVPRGDGPFAYVANGSIRGVSVIDTSTGVTVAEIETRAMLEDNDSDGATAIAVSANGAFVYGLVPSEGAIYVIDTRANQVATTIAVADASVMAASSDGMLYAASDAYHAVLFIDMATNKVTGFAPLPPAGPIFPSGLAVRPDGKVVYVSEESSKTVFAIDVASRSVVGSIPAAGGGAVTFSPSGAFAYAARFLSGEDLVVIDATTHAEIGTVDVDGYAYRVAFAPDGQRAYALVSTLSRGDEVAVIDTTTHTRTGSIPLDTSFGGGLVVSPDGKFVYAGEDDGTVAVIDAASNTVVRLIPLAENNAARDISIVAVPAGLCAVDDEGKTRVTIDELVTAVHYALEGCPGSPPMMSVAR